ncbi:hypothetical protein OGAPHI_002197 [Ogataea philodendri]|uniref:Uncharacterized protein n=1 Tax=Ogataea philodendri TaxID=1378263 RepID=A0A9P8PA74_9ASCO|nr:uncharacterized protein OGAPHI_002197 [Ogataea philodendri]KAH3668443.1 hypothetical protein OGAPHI_002197 [Ogataea philodendri]
MDEPRWGVGEKHVGDHSGNVLGAQSHGKPLDGTRGLENIKIDGCEKRSEEMEEHVGNPGQQVAEGGLRVDDRVVEVEQQPAEAEQKDRCCVAARRRELGEELSCTLRKGVRLFILRQHLVGVPPSHSIPDPRPPRNDVGKRVDDLDD